MKRFDTPLELYKVLPKSNCRLCNLPTCMAFSLAVFKKEKRLADCPNLDANEMVELGGTSTNQTSMQESQENVMEQLKAKIFTVDLVSRAEKTGGTLNGSKLIIKCLGKDFEIDERGNVTSHCHTHAWFVVPLYSYILFGKGLDISGQWVPFRELKHGASRNPLFEQRCEKPLKEIADNHPDLFECLIRIFSGTSSHANNIDSDISVVLFPFPKVPILVSYWKQEDDLESQLHIFFDSTAEENLNIESIFFLGAGITHMLEKIMLKHR